jgi:hypothetical protein
MSSKLRATLSLSKEVERRLLSYGIIAAAGLTAAAPAEAAVVYTYVNQTAAGCGCFDLGVDFDNDTNAEFYLALYNSMPDFPVSDISVIATNAFSSVIGASVPESLFPSESILLPRALQNGAPIGPGSTWERFFAPYTYYPAFSYLARIDSYYGAPVGEFLDLSEPRFVGLQFMLGADTFYGWARVQITTDHTTPMLSLRLIDYAYDDMPDTEIAAGAGIPEPGSLGLLASGVLGLAAWRKRKTAA